VDLNRDFTGDAYYTPYKARGADWFIGQPMRSTKPIYQNNSPDFVLIYPVTIYEMDYALMIDAHVAKQLT
jgi:hypothetical protein